MHINTSDRRFGRAQQFPKGVRWGFVAGGCFPGDSETRQKRPKCPTSIRLLAAVAASERVRWVPSGWRRWRPFDRLASSSSRLATCHFALFLPRCIGDACQRYCVLQSDPKEWTFAICCSRVKKQTDFCNDQCTLSRTCLTSTGPIIL